ncbi:hypothetical protein A2U01_0003230 [Trifolium medium]|uniref:Endonuclease/exonuclease/phosphatase domain-containing protein n=1 Tax=Trifolium medium TaxID=97028 RepID=A0A392M8A6_9FABA|nr:hypothetical protein [Trifolium medium]
MVAGRFGVFLDFDEATVAKLRLDVAIVKLRTVRRGMIDTVLQLSVMGVSYDVWVVEERCSCQEEEVFEEDEGFRCSDRSNSNVGERGWKGDDGDLFSDGRTDSDKSESYQLLLGVEGKVKDGVSAVAGLKEGSKVDNLQGQLCLEMMVGEKESEKYSPKGHVEGLEGCDEENFSCEVEGGGFEVRGTDVVVGPEEDFSFLLGKENVLPVEKEQSFLPVEVGPVVTEAFVLPLVDVGPVGPQVPHWNPFVEVEDQGELGQCSIPAVTVEGRRMAQEEQIINISSDEVDIRRVKGVEVLSEISESSSSSEILYVKGKVTKKKSSKKVAQNGSGRQSVQQVGLPMFRKLAMSLKSAGKRKKDANTVMDGSINRHTVGRSCSGSQQPVPPELTSCHRTVEQPGIDLQVVLPLPPTGINHLVDDDGASVPASFSATEGVCAIREDEAKVLLGIQKDVGFTFEASDVEIQRLGNYVKRRRIKELIQTHKVDFMAIQETKLEDITEALCFSLWGGFDCEWAFLPAAGNSGGILSLWRKTNSSLIFTFIGEGFVGVCLEWGVAKKICYVVNVYAKCDLNAKRRLWENISMSKLGFGEGGWCVVGDFNAVRRREERRGVSLLTPSSSSVEIREFDSFVRNLNLEDLSPVGGKFTWIHSNGVAMSRIDRMMVSEEWSSFWGLQLLRVLPRDVSDHCPLLLKSWLLKIVGVL